MKIVHFYTWALLGDTGPGVAVRGWSEWLTRAGDDVKLVAGTAHAKASVPEGVEFVPLPQTPRDLPVPGSLRRHFAGADVVVVHGGLEVRNHIAARDAAAVGVPYIVNPHGGYSPNVFTRRKVLLKRAWWNTLERKHVERALAVHLFFEDEISHLTRRGVDPRIVLAPNGFLAPAGVAWEPVQDDPYFLWLGRYDPRHKGLDLLAQAVSRMHPAERPRIRLHGVDRRGQKRDVERIVEDLGVKDWIAVGPPIYGEAKWEALAGARGFLHPSRWDASPMAVAEAVSIGLPTLVTSFPLGRFISDRGGAIEVEPEPDSIGEGLRRLMQPQAAEVGARGAQVVREELSWERVARSWRDQVLQIMAGSR